MSRALIVVTDRTIRFIYTITIIILSVGGNDDEEKHHPSYWNNTSVYHFSSYSNGIWI